MKSSDLQATIDQVAGELQAAERAAVAASGDALTAIGATVAGLRIRLEGLRRQFGEAQEVERAQAADRARAVKRDRAKGLQGQAAELGARWAQWVANVERTNQAAGELRAEYHRLQAQKVEISKAARSAGAVVEFGDMDRQMPAELVRIRDGKGHISSWLANGARRG